MYNYLLMIVATIELFTQHQSSTRTMIRGTSPGSIGRRDKLIAVTGIHITLCVTMALVCQRRSTATVSINVWMDQMRQLARIQVQTKDWHVLECRMLSLEMFSGKIPTCKRMFSLENYDMQQNVECSIWKVMQLNVECCFYMTYNGLQNALLGFLFSLTDYYIQQNLECYLLNVQIYKSFWYCFSDWLSLFALCVLLQYTLHVCLFVFVLFSSFFHLSCFFV